MASSTAAARIDEVVPSTGATGTGRPCPQVVRRRRDEGLADWFQKLIF